MSKLKAGIIIDSMLLSAWVSRAIELIISSEYADLSLIIMNGPAKTPALPFLYGMYKSRDGQKPISAPDALAMKNASDLLSGVKIHDKAAVKGSGQEVDIFINFSSNDISLEVHDMSKHGIWSHFFGNAKDASAHGIWEVLKNPVISSGLQIETADGKNKVIYHSYGLADPVSLKVTLNRCYWKSATFASRMLKRLAMNAVVAEENTAPTGKHSASPSNLSFLTAFTKNTGKRVVNKLKRMSVNRDWVLMYDTNSHVGKPFVAREFTQLTAPTGFFWADPIVIEKDGRYYLFIEEEVYAENKARLIAMEDDGRGGFLPPRVILDKPYHLSYPFVFEHEGKYYMIPESANNGTVELYEATDFPYQWEFKRNLLENIIAVDTTVLYQNGKWWVFCNVEENKGAASMDELFLFYSDDIFNSELKSHPQNPIVSDVRRARPAGPLYFKDGQLFRPSQICAPYYGWGISINKVITLTEQDYREEPVATVAPDPTKKMAGIHAIAYAGNMCVVDALVDMKK